MCGIFAVFNIRRSGPPEADLLRAVEAVSHRGPDNLGHFSDPNCFLGHTRLSILGLEANSNQPFLFGDLAMVFNGEVFNYIELREELKGHGYSFSTGSDTEVVIMAYHKWGGECFSRFNGMWALAIYDRKRNELVLSRDRFGQKPLFVMRRGEATYVASEIQQLVPLSDREPDYRLIQMFLKEGTFEGGGRTFFKSMQEFPKAHWCVVDAEGRVDSRRFWDYPGGPVKRTGPEDFCEFEDLLRDAVKLRMRSDVPFGVLLSGGVDSTLVAVYSRELAGSGSGIPAFTYSSRDKYDETRFAGKVAERLGMPLIVREQDQVPVEYLERLRQLVKHMGRGHSSPAVVSVDYLYESMSQAGIKVGLDGQGSDELLAGYKNYFIEVIPWYLIRGRFLQAWQCLRDQWKFGFFQSVLLWLRIVLPEPLKKIGRWLYGYERFFRAYREEPSEALVPRRPSGPRNANKLNRHLQWQHDVGLENLLYYGDIIAMKNSVENRGPFMDHRLVDFAFGRDEKLKLWNAVDKHVLRTLPCYKDFADVLDRDKIGFSSDIKPATKRMMIDELLISPILDWPIFDGSLRRFIAGGGFGIYKYERLMFRLYQVHLWYDLFIAEPRAPRAEGSLQHQLERR